MPEDDNRGFKVNARREDSRKSMRVSAIRRPSSDELPILREQKLVEVQRAIYHQTSTLLIGIRESLNLRPHEQQYDNSCLLAAAISVGEGVARRQGTTRIFDEVALGVEAKKLGLLSDGGMTTERTAGRQAVEEFLERNLGLDLEHIDEREPIDMGRICARSIEDGNVVLLNSAAHWVAIYGLNKRSEDDIDWFAIDPLRTEPQQYTTPQLAERLMGSILLRQGQGVAGELFVVNIQKPNFRAKEFRPGNIT